MTCHISEIEPACGGPILQNQARLRQANTPKKYPPAAGPYSKIDPACGGPHLTPLTKQALKTAFCLKTAIFEMFHSISHQPGRVRRSHLGRFVQKDQAVILSSLNPICIPYNSARENPNTSANPQHLALLPVLLGILPLEGLPPFPFDFPHVEIGVSLFKHPFRDCGAVVGGYALGRDSIRPPRARLWAGLG